MAGSISGYTDTQNLDGILFTSRFNKIPKSPDALRHTSNMSRSAIINLDKITQFEQLYSVVRKAHDALLAFMVATPGRYTYRLLYVLPCEVRKKVHGHHSWDNHPHWICSCCTKGKLISMDVLLPARHTPLNQMWYLTVA